MPAAQRDEILLLGEDFPRYGGYEVVVGRGGRTACAISAGAGELTPARLFKADEAVPNEDGVLAVTEDGRSLVAVADAHFGHESSHAILRTLARTTPLPATPGDLAAAIGACAEPTADYASETTLLAAVWVEDERRVFGVSFGDSTLMLVSRGGAGAVTRKDDVFVTPARPATLAVDPGQAFVLHAPAGALLCAFTDGIDECHYGSPETSVGLADMVALFRRTGPSPDDFVRRLVELALAGTGGNPGGEDNIALAVLAT